MTPVPAGPPADAAGWHESWAEALAELRMSVEEAEAMLEADHADPRHALVVWQPPSGLGPLPAPLVDRARALLSRQLEVAHRLAEAAAHSRRQLRAVEGMRAGPASAPVYIDADG